MDCWGGGGGLNNPLFLKGCQFNKPPSCDSANPEVLTVLNCNA